MFKLCIDKTKKLKSIVAMLQNITKEATIIISHEGIELCELDRSHIVFVNLKVPRTSFDLFILDLPKGQKTEEFKLDIERFAKIIKLAKNHDAIYFVKEDDREELDITFEYEDRRTFRIPPIDIEYKPPTPPELDYSEGAILEIPTLNLKQGLTDLYKLGYGRLYFKVDRLKIKITTETGHKGECARYSYMHGEPRKRVNKVVKSVYSLQRLYEILKAEADPIIEIQIDHDTPLTVTQKIGETGHLRCLLAPRIESEE